MDLEQGGEVAGQFFEMAYVVFAEAAFPASGEDPFAQLEALLKSEPIAGVFSEVPGNPLLQCFDVPRLSALLHEYDVPFFIDDTVATFANVDLLAYVDGIATSLTKLVSGKGDVIALKPSASGEVLCLDIQPNTSTTTVVPSAHSKYWLNVCDLYSRMFFCVPLKRKSSGKD